MTKTHGMSNTKFYGIWKGIKKRCTNENELAYKDYGGRGIALCDRWETFENFKNDMYSSYVEHQSKHGVENTSIERIDYNGNYEPSNCTWATRQEQNRNTRKVRLFMHKGEMLNIAEIARMEGINYMTLRARLLQYGWTLEEAILKSHNLWSKKGYELVEYDGKMQTVTDIAKTEGINISTVFGRLNNQNMSIEEAINVPPSQKEFRATNIKTGETYIYKNQRQFARDFNFKSPSKITLVLNGKRKSTYGFTFEYI